MAKIALGKLSSNNVIGGMKDLIGNKLVITTAWKIKTLTNKLNEELKKYQELRKEILERHCKKKEDGKVDPDEKGNYQFAPEVLEAVSKEMNDLSNIEIEFEPIRIGELVDSKGTPADITAEILLNLGEILDA